MKLWQQAEHYVSERLCALGWNVLARNFRHIGCEIDIIAKQATTVVAFEVKYRTWEEELSNLIPPRKYRAVERGLLHYVTSKDVSYDTLRIDLVLVTKNETGKYAVIHIPNICRD